MDRNLALELVRVTETAALASGRFMGRGDKNGADGAAVEGMRMAFGTVKVRGEVVIGEGELDEAPMLYIGEKVGCGTQEDMEVDIAVDPIEGTTLIAKGLPNVISVVAMAQKGCLLNAPDTYMKKIIVGPRAKGCIDIDAPVEENVRNVAKALNKDISDVTVIIQDRERHSDIISSIRKLGARIRMFGDGDVAAGIATCFENTGVDMLLGIGGAPEGVITAAAVKCMGGDMQCRLNPMSEEEMNRCYEMGFTDEKIKRTLYLDDLAKGDDVFFAATGITDGDLLKGVVHYGKNMIKTHSVVMRSKTGTIRFVDAVHRLDKNEIIKHLMEKYGKK
ncbi:fructose-1,6-bisphosphatase II [Alkalithermobacter thermoalcaliphilus JW-YL-7 = DSM 7308]|uniref:Fructose-1,6-bisphosphatase n=1 Tax=Alkalithermobacter thermoalcaliphilus JW-YL-7 = DSM 7308 TaxID=1121328 RepID=A0A150FSH0_CLOPD|nr:fructose-1,6-bisphosphatase, class II [[Clostridium] paradoxum JW-YL-7 = DSM 7308]SHK71124.1 fructose-1,6-bisphosphatase II [[Clostridium] paradoxum JW-YL-7 = DSM 7308]